MDEAMVCEGCGAEAAGQELVGPHDRLEVVHVAGRDVMRRVGIDPCPGHVAAIRRAREFSGFAVKNELGADDEVMVDAARMLRQAHAA